MIEIKSYGTTRNTKTGSNATSTSISSGSSDYSFLPVYLWGQYFDDTQDIDGDMTVNGTIQADAIKTLELVADEMTVDNLEVNERLKANAALVNDLESKNFKADKARLKNALIDELAASNLVTENLTVTKGAYFFELIIDKIKAAGGAILLTPADGFKIDKVEWTDSTHAKLYWRSEKDGKKIHNMWMKWDQAISQNFNDAKVGKSYDVSSKYWWSLVTETNNETNNSQPVTTVINNEEVQCHYIVVSAAKNEFTGDVNPEVGDEVAMLGSRVADENRQCAQYMAAYASLDIDLKAPLFAQYKGIDDFDLASHKITWFSSGLTAAGEVKGLLQNEITGSFRTSSGKTLEDLIDEAKQSTAYRLISSTSTIRIDSNGNISPSTFSMTILKNESGNTATLNTVPDMMTVEIYETDSNTRIAKFNSGQSMSVPSATIASYHGAYAILASSTDATKVYDKMQINVIQDASIDINVEGDITSFDRLIDNGSVVKLLYDHNKEGNNRYSLAFSIDVMVMHYEGTNATRVTTSSTPSCNSFIVAWEWDKKSNTTNNSSGGVCTLSSNTWTASGTDVAFNPTVSSNDYKSYLKIMLKKSSNTGMNIDTIVIPVTMKSEAVFEIVQGEVPHIATQVTQTITDEYGNVTNNLSEMMQRAEEIYTRVQELSEQGISQSVIDQTAEQITLTVQSDLGDKLQRAGIDINSYMINLNADNTNINGSLNIYGGEGNGFKVWNGTQGNANKSVQIINKSLGYVQTYMINSFSQQDTDSVNVIGMDGVAFSPNYNQFTWWGKSSSGSEYEFIVRNKYHNFRIREDGLFRTVADYASYISTPTNGNLFPTAGKNMLDTDIQHESWWADIATTTPVYEFTGSHDFTSNGSGGGGDYPDDNFRKCGIFICAAGNSGGGYVDVTFPNPHNCCGRMVIFKGLTPGVTFRFRTHTNTAYFMCSEDTDTHAIYTCDGQKTMMLVCAGGYWIIMRGY